MKNKTFKNSSCFSEHFTLVFSWGLFNVCCYTRSSSHTFPLTGEASSAILAFSFWLVQSFVMSSKWLSKSTKSVWSPESSSWLATERVSSHCLSIILREENNVNMTRFHWNKFMNSSNISTWQYWKLTAHKTFWIHCHRGSVWVTMHSTVWWVVNGEHLA